LSNIPASGISERLSNRHYCRSEHELAHTVQNKNFALAFKVDLGVGDWSWRLAALSGPPPPTQAMAFALRWAIFHEKAEFRT